MNKQVISVLLAALLVLGMPGISALGQTTLPPVELVQPIALYTIDLWVGSPVYASMDKQDEVLGYVPQGKTVQVLAVDPFWLYIRYQESLQGYIRRSNTLDATVKVVDPDNTPLYSTVNCGWLGWVLGEAPVLSAPMKDAEVLITLQDGARLALIDITDGWARVIYHRQYGYVDTRLLSEILPVNNGMLPGNEAPIAAYTSFYKITTDQSNLNRMVNLQVANDRFEEYILAKGDKLDFNRQIGPYTRHVGYLPANAFVNGEVVQSYGGGTCQVSSTLYNVVLQLPEVAIIKRRPHGQAAASYLPHGADAAVGSAVQNFIIQNLYDFPVRIDGTAQDGALTIAVYRAD